MNASRMVQWVIAIAVGLMVGVWDELTCGINRRAGRVGVRDELACDMNRRMGRFGAPVNV
jgi:hypothetical protein